MFGVVDRFAYRWFKGSHGRVRSHFSPPIDMASSTTELPGHTTRFRQLDHRQFFDPAVLCIRKVPRQFTSILPD